MFSYLKKHLSLSLSPIVSIFASGPPVGCVFLPWPRLNASHSDLPDVNEPEITSPREAIESNEKSGVAKVG